MRFLLTFIFLLTFGISSAQTYHPFVKDNALWRHLMTTYDGNYFNHYSETYFIQGDTNVGGTDYYILFGTNDNDTAINQTAKINALVREDSSKRVFLRYQNSTKDSLLYDFGLQPGDTFATDSVLAKWFVVQKIDTITLSGQVRRKIEFTSGRFWVEGIGALIGGFFGPHYIDPYLSGIGLACYFDSSFYWAADKDKGCLFVGLNEKNISKPIAAFPNPTDGIINITGIEQELDYSIFNLSGQSIQKGIIEPGYSIDISDQPNGLYLLKLFNDKRLVGSFKILKK